MTYTPLSRSTPLTLPHVNVARPASGIARFASSTSRRSAVDGELFIGLPERNGARASTGRPRRYGSSDAEQVLDRQSLQGGEGVTLGAGPVDVVVLERRAIGQQLLVGLALPEGGPAQLHDARRLEGPLYLRVGPERPRPVAQGEV